MLNRNDEINLLLYKLRIIFTKSTIKKLTNIWGNLTNIYIDILEFRKKDMNKKNKIKLKKMRLLRKNKDVN